MIGSKSVCLTQRIASFVQVEANLATELRNPRNEVKNFIVFLQWAADEFRAKNSNSGMRACGERMAKPTCRDSLTLLRSKHKIYLFGV